MSINKTLRRVFLVAFLTCSTFCMAQKQDFSRLITAIATVESSLNEKAVSGDCVGYLQIRHCVVKSCNEYLEKQGSKKRFTLKDRYNKEKSIEMFTIYQKKHNPTFNIERALCVWNAGPYSKKKPVGYIRKVMKVYNSL